MKFTIVERIEKTPLLEGTRYDNQAAKILSDSGLFDEETSRKIIDALFREDIHAFNHAPNWLEKYLKGIARMIVEESNGSAERAEQFLRESPSVFEQYLTWVKENREKVGNSIDNEFVNKMHYKDVVEFLEKVQDERIKKSKAELEKMKFSSSNYSLVPIDSFEQFKSLYGGRATGDGSSDKCAGGGGTAWCHTNSKSTYDSWTSRGQRFFVLQNNDWKNIPFNPKTNQEKNGKDEYGNSLIAILTDKYGRLLNATLRCNHVGVSANADNQYNTYAELSRVAGFNVEEEINKYFKDVEYVDPSICFVVQDGVLLWDYDKAEKYNIHKGDILSVTIPNSVNIIGESTFAECTQLHSITIPDTVERISYGAFNFCRNLSSIIIPHSVVSIGTRAFSTCSGLTSITLHNGVEKLGNYVFADCYNLTSIIIPDSVVDIGRGAFFNCSGLTTITIGSGVTSIEKYTFEGCSGLTSITIPDSVTSIGNSAFSDCRRLTSITIPNSVTSIGDYAFYNCLSLVSITIGDGVTTIGYKALGTGVGTTIYTDNPYVKNYCEENNIPVKPRKQKTEGIHRPLNFRLVESIDGKDVLYRTETAYGSGVRDLRGVIEYEIIELGNTDIIETLLDTFKVTEEQDRKLNKYLDNFEYEDEVVDICMDIIRNKYPQAKYALWLADKDTVKSLYGGSDEDIDAYEIEYEMPISDLGYDGKLFVYSKEPKPIVS